ncbi:unnamed protein product [Diplocarpon coronariae]
MQSIIALSVALFAATSAAVPKITFGNSDTRVYADAEFPLNTHRTIVDAYKSTNFNNNGKYEAHYFQLSGTDRDAHCELTIPDSTATYTVSGARPFASFSDFQFTLDVADGVIYCKPMQAPALPNDGEADD